MMARETWTWRDVLRVTDDDNGMFLLQERGASGKWQSIGIATSTLSIVRQFMTRVGVLRGAYG